MSTLSLDSCDKLKTSQQFRAVSKDGTKIVGKCFLIIHKRNDQGYARLGITVSKKTSKKAVVRNRLKRVIRESFRLRKQSLPKCDIIVISRKYASTASAAELGQDLAKLWQKLIR